MPRQKTSINRLNQYHSKWNYKKDLNSIRNAWLIATEFLATCLQGKTLMRNANRHLLIGSST